jgi:hypothetical protein
MTDYRSAQLVLADLLYEDHDGPWSLAESDPCKYAGGGLRWEPMNRLGLSLRERLAIELGTVRFLARDLLGRPVRVELPSWECERCLTVNEGARAYCVECRASCEYVDPDAAARWELGLD